MIDFHSHILPGIDDGASNVDEALKILKALKAQGVDVVAATPHYYDCYTDAEEFLAARDESYKKLADALRDQKEKVPKIILGAEVRLSFDAATDPLLDKLCIGDTKCILLELPDGFWFDWVYDAIKTIKREKGLIPIIAHLERYIPSPKHMEALDKLFELEAKIQVNAESVTHRRLWRIIKALLDKNQVHIIGSDAHNITSRRPKLDEAKKVIVKFYGDNCWEQLKRNAMELIYKERIGKCG